MSGRGSRSPRLASRRITRRLGAALALSGTVLLSIGAVRAQQADTGAAGMGSMSGGTAPSGARDANGYSDGHTYGSMPGFEKADQLPISKLLAEQLESVTLNGRIGAAWNVQGWYGPDLNKLWIRTEGAVVDGKTEDATGAEALWWHAVAPFWATQLGIRQDLGPGSHTWAAFGLEGLTPYWFDVEATGYVGDDGRLMARLEGSYDLLITNRLILTPRVEAIAYDRTDRRRDTGTGLGSVGVGVRLRYEIRRKLAPYVGYTWDRATAGTARLARAAGEGSLEADSGWVAGLRVWW